ncbi:Tapeworm specific antigen B [Echinococcus multilocularis]|nr:Tapeworm specific antigen B [Echinococcus multilocularis]CDS36680.1 Tapeworm specific antigen B [Echinococcus multilocularis]
MKFCMLLALALVSFVVVARADDDEVTQTKKGVMKAISEIKHFFQSDPLGKKLVEVMKEVGSVCQMVRKKARMALKEYVRKLIKEDE